jgi:O-succinylbenzoate synthase
MKQQVLPIARKVAAKLFAAEDAIDVAFAQTADLAGFLPEARQQARVSAVVGQPAVEQLVRVMAALSEARRVMVETHVAFASLQSDVGLRERNFGGFIEKPAPTERAELQLVS